MLVKYFFKFFLIFLASIFTFGCGAPAKSTGVLIANPETVEIFYENNCSACYKNAINKATMHCEKFGRIPVPLREAFMTIDGFGRTVTTFVCKKN
jgi:hypothetical protein